MIFLIFLILISLGATGSLYYFLGLYQQWYWFWVIIVGIPVFFLLGFGLTLGILLIISKTINTKKEVLKPKKVARFIVNQVTYVLIMLSGTRIRTHNLDSINRKQKYMIVYNHTSNFDPMIIFSRIPKVICITKPENFKIPLAGPFVHEAGYISIDRENDSEGIKSIQRAIDCLNNNYGSICVAPEGTRSKTHELLPFRPGCFNIAKRANTPILVIGLKNAFKIHENFMKRFTTVDMKVLGVIQPEEVERQSTAELSQNIHTMYESYLGGE